MEDILVCRRVVVSAAVDVGNGCCVVVDIFWVVRNSVDADDICVVIDAVGVVGNSVENILLGDGWAVVDEMVDAFLVCVRLVVCLVVDFVADLAVVAVFMVDFVVDITG